MDESNSISHGHGTEADDYLLYQDATAATASTTWIGSDVLHVLTWAQDGTKIAECWSKLPIDIGEAKMEVPAHDVSENAAPNLPPIRLSMKIGAQAKVQYPLKLSDLAIQAVFDKELTIHSPLILELLGRKTHFGLIHDLESWPGPSFDEPFYELLHYVPIFEEALAEIETELCQHITSLLTCLRPFIHSMLVPARADVSQSPGAPTVPFTSLWYLFAPGSEVYFRAEPFGKLQGAIVVRYRYINASHRSGKFELQLAFLQMGKSKVYKRRETLELPFFPGCKPILELACFPAEYMDRIDGGKLRNRRLQECRTFLGLVVSEYPEMHYDGSTLFYRDSDRDTLVRGDYRGNIVVDYYAMFEETMPGPSKIGNHIGATIENSELDAAPFKGSPVLDEEWWTSGRQDRQTIEERLDFLPKPLTQRHAFLLTHYCAAYALRDKSWICVDVAQLSEISRAENPLENVVIPEADVALIQALTYRRPKGSDVWSVDFITGKGVGKIVLLHGPPGVGKTYTVECIAEAFAMPLLSITIANVRLEETWVEKDLQMWFRLAERWNAVLLLDEADVFLERRQPSDLARNALVAALLRHLEYFTGLLFLTTNRVGQIDDAFASRIHVVIGYSKINNDSRQKIWNAFFDKFDREHNDQLMIGENARNYVLKDPEVNSLNWNGREVRNALQTVISLAEYQASLRTGRNKGLPVIVEEAHFRQYMQMSRAYQNYTQNVAKADESKRAYLRQERFDYPA